MSARMIFSLIVVSLTLCLAVWVLFANPKSRINLWYSLAMASTGLWGLTEVLSMEGKTPQAVLLWGVLSYAFGVAIPFCFLHFSFHFPFQERKVSPVVKMVIVCALLLAVMITLTPGVMASLAVVRPTHGDLIKNPSGWTVWFVIFISMFAWAYGNLFRKWKRSSGIFRSQLAHVIAFTIVPAIIAIIFDVIISYFTESLGWVGVQTLLILALGVFYYLTFLGRNLYLRRSV